MRSTWLKLAGALVVVLGMAGQAQAAPITLMPTLSVCGSPECLLGSGMETGQAKIDAAIALIFNSIPVTGVDDLYKDDVGTGEADLPFKNSYSTSYAVAGLNLASARISYDGGDPISGSHIYALIKDGNTKDLTGVHVWYLFDISTWDGTSDVNFSGFYAGDQGRISHVSIYGTQGVPDGGSMVMLLGMALLGLAGMRRRTFR